jgi:predicted nucleic acid-binding protein
MGTVIIDACLVISFGNAGALHIIEALRTHRVVMASRAHDEVRKPPAATALATAIQNGTISIERVDLSVDAEQDALAKYDSRFEFRGAGDAEVLALAATRGYIVGSDDRTVRSTAQSDLGGAAWVAGCVDFLKWAVVEGRLTPTDAAGVLARLDLGPAIIRRLTAQGQPVAKLFE